MYAVYRRGVVIFSLPAVHEGASETAYALGITRQYMRIVSTCVAKAVEFLEKHCMFV